MDNLLATLPHRFAAVNNMRTIFCLLLLAITVGGLSFVFGKAGDRIATQMCVNAAAVVALGVYCGNTGIVSFGHGAFMTIGAYLSGILTMPAMLQKTALPQLPNFLSGHELSIWSALPVVALAGLLFAIVSGAAIARLAGASATIATLGLLIITHSVAIGARDITRGSQTFFGVPRITDLTFAFTAAIIFIILARFYRESRFGLNARAARDDPDAASALDINPQHTRFIAWCVSGMLTTLAGSLYGHMLGAFSPASFYLSLVFAQVVMMIVGGMSSVAGAVAGVITITLLQDFVRRFEGGAEMFGFNLPEVFGLTTIILGVMILFIIRLRPQGLVGGFELGPGADTKIFKQMRKTIAPAAPPPKAEPAQLSVKNLTKGFEGVKAVSKVSLDIPTGRVTGLIGPNGAGKSTLVNLLSRQYDADEGEVAFAGFDLTKISREQIAQLGLARSFQNLRMFKGLTSYENVFVAALAKGLDKKTAAAVTLRELNDFDLGAVADMRANELPYGARKRLEIARALAQEPSILLLDEPAAGMNPVETDDLAERLFNISKIRGIGILLIDHDLRFVTRLSDWIMVMNRGELIAQGTPKHIKSDPSVIEAYIGRGRTANQNNLA